jgi:hypothetical protein
LFAAGRFSYGCGARNAVAKWHVNAER